MSPSVAIVVLLGGAIVFIAGGSVVIRTIVSDTEPRPSILKALVAPAILLGIVFGLVAVFVLALDWVTRGWLR
jgi:hypothetical protein